MHNLIKQQLMQLVCTFVIFALALFLPAGTLAWPAGWVFLALFFGFYLALTIWLIRYNPALLQERTRLWTSDQQGWDRVLFPVLLLYSVLWLSFLALDTEYLHWSSVPMGVQVLGGIILISAFALLFVTFRENTYLSAVVRIQQDRGHHVIMTGPYQYVRHPMYAGIVIFVVGTSLLLGSWSGLLVGALFIITLARRAILEERTLQKQLAGYAAYMAHVKYRLIPYVW
jgi:protein-S-isoprenylcysteine O-methyltransferase Ste14